MNNLLSHVFTIAKMLLMCLPFIYLCIRSNRVNLEKTERSKQFVMPVFAVIYSIVILIFLNKINTFLVGRLQAIAAWLENLAGINGLPDSINGIISLITGKISAFLSDLNFNFWVFFISNCLIMAAYLFLKKIIIEICRLAVKNDSSLYRRIAETFYDYHEDKNVWCIKDKYIQADVLLKVLYYSTLVITIILTLVSRRFYLNELFKTVFYPAFSVILVGELFFYLNGITWAQYLNNIGGDDEDAYRTVNYTLLRKALKTIFGDKLLADNTLVNNSLTYSTTNDEIIEKLEESEDSRIIALAAFMRRLNREGFEIDHNYVFSTQELLTGRSVLFNNPFYNDLIPYAFYPMNQELLKHNKVLVLLGRHAIEDDIIDWLERGIGAVTNLPYLWKISELGVDEADKTDTDIGIITRSNMLNAKLIHSNADFFSKVSYCVIIEPSKLLPTSQIGMGLIIRKCKEYGSENITFCMSDKNSDGLVDALSHVLMTNLTEVSATNKHKGTSSYMCWDTDDDHLHHRMFPNVSRYLGTGTELSFLALKNQVSKARWFGGEAFPVTDMNWIDKQYYYDLTKYAGIPSNQDTFNERFVTSPNMWSAPVSDINYLTVEDESYNMFEILRLFSTRSVEQGFINVISSDYLLREYMSVNAPIFETDPKAIPYISADYARSERNTVLRLLLRLRFGPVLKSTIEKEIVLLGLPVQNIAKQFWYEIYKCFADVASINELPEKYDEAVDEAYGLSFTYYGRDINSSSVEFKDEYNVHNGKVESYCDFSDKLFLERVSENLKSAGYIAEDEKGDRYYVGAELSSHIFQRLLPGQFFTFGGKFYEMLYVTADNNILIRRAADHIANRRTYRQIRNYNLHEEANLRGYSSVINLDGLRITKSFACFSVDTSGYYSMENYGNFKTAQKIVFEENNQIPERVYRNKQFIKIEIPSLADRFTDEVRFTITVLLNEVFRTIFAENQQFIVATTDTSFLEEKGDTVPLTYTVSGDCVNDKAIYIFEDSSLDLGLLVSFERNIRRIFKIIDDYLDWHLEEVERSKNPPKEPEPYTPPVVNNEEEPEEKLTLLQKIKRPFVKLIEKIKGLFKRKKKKGGKEDGGNDTEGEGPVTPVITPPQEFKPVDPYTPTEIPEVLITAEPSEDIGLPEDPFISGIDENSGEINAESDFSDDTFGAPEDNSIIPEEFDVSDYGIPDLQTVDYSTEAGSDESVGENAPDSALNGGVSDMPEDNSFIPSESVASDTETTDLQKDDDTIQAIINETQIPDDIWDKVSVESPDVEGMSIESSSDSEMSDSDDAEETAFIVTPDGEISQTDPMTDEEFNDSTKLFSLPPGFSGISFGSEEENDVSAEDIAEETDGFNAEDVVSAETEVAEGENTVSDETDVSGSEDVVSEEIYVPDSESIDSGEITTDSYPNDETTDTVSDIPAESVDAEEYNEIDSSETEDGLIDVPVNEPVSDEQPDENDISVNDIDSGANPGQETIPIVELQEEENSGPSEESEEEPEKPGEIIRERKPYFISNFMLFGEEEVPSQIDIVSTLGLLNELGFDRNELKQAREARKNGVAEEESYVPNKPGAKYCDFCAAEIFGIEYETLSDGRDRCVNCSNSSVKTAEEFKKIFLDVKRNLESLFGIKINEGIRVEMVSSKKLHKRLGESFVPSDSYDPRTIGVAIKDKTGYTLCVESGAPRIQTMLTTAHELTHIWQYLNWNEKKLAKKYGKHSLLEIYEGMAKWVEIQYAYLINEPNTAKREEILTVARDDEYGRGFIRYASNYPFSQGTTITRPTPFLNIDDPLTPKS